MSNKKRKPADDRLFFKSYHETREAPAWKQLPPGARELFYELKKEYHHIQQGPVYLSARLAAERLGCDKASVVRWYAELEHYGFIVKVRAAQIGEKGLAAHYRLTDEIYLGEPPSKEFSFWNGTRYVRKKRTYQKTENPIKRGSRYVRKMRTYLESGHLVDGTAGVEPGESQQPGDAVVVPIGAAAGKLPWSTPKLTEITDTEVGRQLLENRAGSRRLLARK